MIVKVQKPLASNEKNPPWMICGKGRIHMQMVDEKDLPELVLNRMKNTNKQFFHADLGEDGKFHFVRIAPYQSW